MKQTRRGFLGSFAAIAAAVATARAVKVEAAPSDTGSLRMAEPGELLTQSSGSTTSGAFSVYYPKSDGLYVRLNPGEIRIAEPGEMIVAGRAGVGQSNHFGLTPTFEEMAADCRSMGHTLVQEGPDSWSHRADPNRSAWDYIDHAMTYERVDAWRRELHA